MDLDLKQVLFIKHSQVCWLSIGPALQHMTDQRQDIYRYMAPFEKCKNSFKECQLQGDLRCYTQTWHESQNSFFSLSINPVFEESLTEFGCEQPMTHLLPLECPIWPQACEDSYIFLYFCHENSYYFVAFLYFDDWKWVNPWYTRAIFLTMCNTCTVKDESQKTLVSNHMHKCCFCFSASLRGTCRQR